MDCLGGGHGSKSLGSITAQAHLLISATATHTWWPAVVWVLFLSFFFFFFFFFFKFFFRCKEAEIIGLMYFV